MGVSLNVPYLVAAPLFPTNRNNRRQTRMIHRRNLFAVLDKSFSRSGCCVFAVVLDLNRFAGGHIGQHERAANGFYFEWHE